MLGHKGWEEIYKSKNAYYVDYQIFDKEAILKVINFVKKMREIKLEPDIINRYRKKMIILEEVDDDYDENNTDESDPDCVIYYCEIIEGKDWKIIVIEDFVIIINIKDQFQSKICVKGGHPTIISSEFFFANSDGSTEWKNIKTKSAWEMIIETINRILEYSFNQIH
jgi:hypothetical protein